jgi:arabinofuranosyltransferase
MGHAELAAADGSPSNPPAVAGRTADPTAASSARSHPDSPVVDAPPLGRSLRDRLELVLVGLVAAAVAVTGWLHRWTADDAFINFRVVDNLLAGNGPVFNAGERVEVATSSLWLVLLTAAEAVVPGTALAWSSVVLGLAGTVLGVATATLAARRLFLRTTRWLTVPFGAVALAALPPFWDFATSGLETGLSFAWIGTSFLCAVRVAGDASTAPRRALLCALLLGLGPLVRPDLAVVSAALLVWLVFAVPGSWRRRSTRVLAAGALPVAVEVFRMGYYGLLVPNTAVAKESSRAVWGRGWNYLVDLVQPHLLWLPLLLGLAVLAWVLPRTRWRRSEALLVAAVVLAALAHTLYVVRVGGDFMHGRFLLPSLFLLLCPVMAAPLPAPARRALPVAAAVTALAVWCAVSAVVLRPDYLGSMSTSGIADERGYWAARADNEHPVTLEDHGRNGVLTYTHAVARMQERGEDVIAIQVAPVGPDTPVAVLAPSSGGVVFGVSNAGFYGVGPGLQVPVVDRLGLTDPVASHMEAPPPGRAGHEKRFPLPWLLARYGSAQLAETSTPGLPAPGDVAAARASLTCGQVAELVAATSEPMSWERFRDNVTGAVERTSFRIPADPEMAEARFC